MEADRLVITVHVVRRVAAVLRVHVAAVLVLMGAVELAMEQNLQQMAVGQDGVRARVAVNLDLVTILHHLVVDPVVLEAVLNHAEL